MLRACASDASVISVFRSGFVLVVVTLMIRVVEGLIQMVRLRFVASVRFYFSARRSIQSRQLAVVH